MENSTVKYNVIFEGNIKNSADVTQVKHNMAALFKVEISVIDRIFRETPTILQKGRKKEKALKYKEVFEQTGALCRIEAVPPPTPPITVPAAPLQVDLPAVPRAQPSLYSPPPPQPEKPAALGPRTKDLEKDAWKALGSGLALAVILFFMPFLSFVFTYLIVLVHELGHAIFGWFYGYPSLPAFDFMYGGGITAHQDRTMIIVVIVYLLLGWFIYLLRRNPLSLIIMVIIVISYSFIAFTSAHQVILLFMGHGTELLFAITFLYRALSGSSVLVPAERPLYAFLGFFILFMDIRFAHRLMTSAVYRAEYGAAKGGGDWMDFSRLSVYFGVELTSVAAFFLFLCLLVPVTAYLIFRYKEYIGVFFNRLLEQ